MSRTQVLLFAVAGFLAGSTAFGFVVLTVAPYAQGQTLSPNALALFLSSMLLASIGLGSLTALLLHSRWPGLAGRQPQRRGATAPRADAALRQGVLMGLTLVTVAGLAITRTLDITFLIVVLLIAGLMEAYAQTRA